MAKKILWVSAIVFVIGAVYVIISAVWPAVIDMINIAGNDSSAGNYPLYQAATRAAPLWLYLLPAVVGLFGIILVLRRPER